MGLFQSTPPIRVATFRRGPLRLAIHISIHATHTGGDHFSHMAPPFLCHFNPRHPYGWRRARQTSGSSTGNFNPRHPYGWRLASATFFGAMTNFNPRHPYGWRPDCGQPTLAQMPISIHATHTGGDAGAQGNARQRHHFNPRHPYGWRLVSLSIPSISVSFQSTPPIRVATRLSNGNTRPFSISIHATHTGGDYPGSSRRPPCPYFNPRHPYGWRLCFRYFQDNFIVFQSTPPIRVATPSTGPSGSVVLFQSTPPIRVATYSAFRSTQASTISIHATHTGGDQTRPRKRFWNLYFNPRHPYGWRQTLIVDTADWAEFQSTPPIRVATYSAFRAAFSAAISIHATHTGGDSFGIRRKNLFENFNPRHPYGWRLYNFKHDKARIWISIHATHTGGDVGGRKQRDGDGRFQSTPPIRVATRAGLTTWPTT